MNTFQLSCFLAVANTLSFARAAEAMKISQPAITHQIKSLESELNVQLFHRTTRMVELTHEGRSFLSDAKSMIAIEVQAKARFHDPEAKSLERLSIGCSSYNQLVLLTDSLTLLRKQHPNLHPHLVVVPHDQLYQLLDNGTVDMIFDIFDSAKDTGKLTYRELRKSPIACVCEKGHPITNTDPVSVSDLKEQNLIFCNPINLVPEVAKLQWELAEGKNPAQLHFCPSVEASIVLASAGFGMAVLPEFLLPHPVEHLSIVQLCDAPQLSFGFFYKPFPGDTLLRTFIQLAKDCCQDPPCRSEESDLHNPAEQLVVN